MPRTAELIARVAQCRPMLQPRSDSSKVQQQNVEKAADGPGEQRGTCQQDGTVRQLLHEDGRRARRRPGSHWDPRACAPQRGAGGKSERILPK